MEKQKEFNITGTCIPERHYLIPPNLKIRQIMEMVEEGRYFTINRPRQYGKTTTLFFLLKELQKREEFLPIWVSFEEFGNKQLQNEENFFEYFSVNVEESLASLEGIEFDSLLKSLSTVSSFLQFRRWLTRLITTTNQKVILLIDEVDQAGNYPLFFQFLVPHHALICVYNAV